MKRRTAIVTDSSSELPRAVAEELGIGVVASRFAFADETFSDGELSARAFYERLAKEQKAPRIFGVGEAAFREAFERALETAETVLCLVTPFDVSATFT